MLLREVAVMKKSRWALEPVRSPSSGLRPQLLNDYYLDVPT